MCLHLHLPFKCTKWKVISFKPEGEEDELGPAHGVAAAEPADGDGGGRAEQGQEGEGDGEGRPPRVVGRVQCPGLSNVIRCDFYGTEFYKRITTYLHEVEDEVRRADECPGPKVADPHGVGVGLHGAADVGGAFQCQYVFPIFWNCSKQK